MPESIRENYRKLVAKAEAQLAERQSPQALTIQVGSATCERAAGAQDVEDEFHKHIEASGRDDIVLRRTGCTGRCSCEPIVGIFGKGDMPVKYQQVDREAVHEIFTSHVMGGKPVADLILDESPEPGVHPYELLFCSGARCGRQLPFDVRDTFERKLAEHGLQPPRVRIVEANCFGLCSQDERGSLTHVLVRPDRILYKVSSDADIEEILESHIENGRPVERLREEDKSLSKRFFDLYGDVAFFNRQSRVALRNAGVVDPQNLMEYLHFAGFDGLTRALEKNDPQYIIDEVLTSRLRGRGGGGFPTGRKWTYARQAEGQPKYIICNADEGDPGAFMDRSMLESDPFSVLEGMIIGGFAIGANQGFLYVRAEYPLAIRRIEHAIDQCRECGLLGKDILGSGFDFDLEIRLGAGAFVCGEETSLINSIEGERGQPRIRPPYPSTRGLWGQPTVINNVETFANIPAILSYGGEWFSHIGTAKSGGTKVFALAGKVNHTGLVEVPMGTTLREIVFDIGGGIPDGKEIKAVQTGGPAGGCLPATLLDTEVDYETLQKLGSIMGSGGLIVMDEDDCMVDIAKFYLAFSQEESCGKCTPCREGTKRMLEILERLTQGEGSDEEIEHLERLAVLMKKASLCGLGRAAPNPVLSTLEHFRDEYEAHARDKRCPARRCVAMIHYEINPEKCVGCTACARHCPVQCIDGEPRNVHVIDQSRCIKCGRCYQVCRFEAVDRS